MLKYIQNYIHKCIQTIHANTYISTCKKYTRKHMQTYMQTCKKNYNNTSKIHTKHTCNNTVHSGPCVQERVLGQFILLQRQFTALQLRRFTSLFSSHSNLHIQACEVTELQNLLIYKALSHIHAKIRTRIHANIQTKICAYIHTKIHAYIHANLHAKHTYTHTCKHT